LRALVTEFDEHLLVEAAQRDRRHFAQLYENNFHQIYAYIASRVTDRTEAEDLTAEVFHHALAKLEGYEWRGVPFRAWLLRIAANLLHDRWRDPVSRREMVGHDLPDQGTTDNAERRALLSQLVERLPADQRLVVVRRFLDGRTVAEIAREMQRSEGAIKQLQFRALQSLRAHFPERNSEDK
jgi:RNA polymerase sigma-70 factor, ECF subfamily